LAALAVVAVTGVPTYLTGEPAEVVIMDAPDFAEDLVKAHDRSATWAFSVTLAAGVAGLAGLIAFRKANALPGWLKATVLALSIIAAVLLAWTANLGGKIRHTEIRSGPQAGAPQH
ncbi:MAG TPA: hypothetical protein VEO95_12285, partial [Chthoniobacteraceae bacterium]|nr:hypothetical protein [Chthoniobacteraceae bacterium]